MTCHFYRDCAPIICFTAKCLLPLYISIEYAADCCMHVLRKCGCFGVFTMFSDQYQTWPPLYLYFEYSWCSNQIIKSRCKTTGSKGKRFLAEIRVFEGHFGRIWGIDKNINSTQEAKQLMVQVTFQVPQDHTWGYLLLFHAFQGNGNHHLSKICLFCLLFRWIKSTRQRFSETQENGRRSRFPSGETNPAAARVDYEPSFRLFGNETGFSRLSLYSFECTWI